MCATGVDGTGTPVTSLMTSEALTDDDYDDDNLSVMIGVSVAAAVLLMIVVVLVVILVCRVRRRRSAQSDFTRDTNIAWQSDDAVSCTDVTRRPRQSLFFSLLPPLAVSLYQCLSRGLRWLKACPHWRQVDKLSYSRRFRRLPKTATNCRRFGQL